MVKATRACFPATVEASGFLIPRDEVAVRPDRPGARVIDVLAEPGETVTQGQALARIDGATIQAPFSMARARSRISQCAAPVT